MVRRHVGAQTGNQNERLASTGQAKEVEKERYAEMYGGENTLGGERRQQRRWEAEPKERSKAR
jgi:hypothetical protein